MSDRLTAMDVQKQEFRRAFRGCAPEEVRMYLQSVAEELKRLSLENGDLREETGRLRADLEEFKKRDRTLQATLVSAQKMADELRQRSRSEADLMIKEARMKSERTLQESQDQLARLEAEISRAKLERDLFEKRVRATIEEHLDLLEHRGRGADRSDFTNVRPIRRLGTDAG